MEIEIAIETTDPQLIADLLETTSSNFQIGSQVTVADGATLTLQNINRRRSLGAMPEIITLGLSLSTSVATNLVSTWLYEKLKGRASGLRVDRKKIPIDSEEIEKNIQQKNV